MKVAVVYFPYNDRSKLQDVARGIADGVGLQDYSADLVDGTKDVNAKLTMYDYIAVGTEAAGFWGGKIPDRVGHFLSNAGIVSGKRSFAFITARGIRTMKTLRKLMDAMEHEGMFLKNSRIVASYEEAKQIGRTLV